MWKFVCFLLALSASTEGSELAVEYPTCNEELIARPDVQNFSSPNFPLSYNDSADCAWVVQAPRNQQVRVTFNVIETERCCDVITIRDGLSEKAPIYATLRGNLPKPATFVSNFGSFYIRFQSDDSVVAQGFLASYESVQRIDFELEATDESKAISTKNYPKNYPDNDQRCWMLNAEEGKQVELTVLRLSTELCCDYVVVYDMTEPPQKLIMLKGTYNRKILPFVSTSGFMLVCFSSNEKNSFPGFKAKFRSVPTSTSISTSIKQRENITCGGDLKVPDSGHGEFDSPVVVRSYPNDIRCTWVIRAKPQAKIRLWFSYVHTERCCDWIVVRDGALPDSAKLRTISGTPFNFNPVTSTGDIIRVEFTSDYINVGRGFRAIFEIAKEDNSTSNCGGSLNALASPQYFSSPNWPNAPYENNLNCVWLIKAAGSRMVALTILGVLTEPYFDIIRIRNGLEMTNRRVALLHGRYYVRWNILGSGKGLRVEFTTDRRIRAGGFRAVYQSVGTRQEFVKLLASKAN